MILESLVLGGPQVQRIKESTALSSNVLINEGASFAKREFKPGRGIGLMGIRSREKTYRSQVYLPDACTAIRIQSFCAWTGHIHHLQAARKKKPKIS